MLSAYRYIEIDNENGIAFIPTFVLSNTTFTLSFYQQIVNFATSGSSMTVKIIPYLVLFFQGVPYCHSTLQFRDGNRQQQLSNWMQQLWCSIWGEDIVQKGNNSPCCGGKKGPDIVHRDYVSKNTIFFRGL